MNQLTTIELAKQAGCFEKHSVYYFAPEELEAFRALIVAERDKELMGVGMEPDTHCFDDDTEKDVWSYSADKLAAARLQDKQARQQAQIENESLKARIARADAEKAREVLPLQKRIAELEAQLAERKPLTDEELYAVFPAIATYHEANKTLYRSIARAIEAAHGIG